MTIFRNKLNTEFARTNIENMDFCSIVRVHFRQMTKKKGKKQNHVLVFLLGKLLIEIFGIYTAGIRTKLGEKLLSYSMTQQNEFE